MKDKRFKILRVMLPIILLSVFFLSIYQLNKPMDGAVPTAASKLIFERGYVSEVLSSNATPDTWTEGIRLGMQEVIVVIDGGKYDGMELYAKNYLNAYSNIDLHEGSRVIVNLDKNEQGEPYIAYIANHDRSKAIIFLLALFVGVLVLLGGKKGIAALLGLLFTFLSIWFFMIPLVERGFSAIGAAIILVAITTFVSLYLLNGLSYKTMIASVGCVGGVAIAGIMAVIAGYITPISGFNMSEAEEIVLRASDYGLQIKGLLVSGILIAALGAVMDIALTITSAIEELHKINPKAKQKVLFQSGLNIGRDAMGTMTNTLILAFTGASLNLMILFRAYDYPYIQIFNSDMVTIEIIQGIAGSIGIVLTVPLVAGLSAMVYGRKDGRKAE